jgi:hypothetical protein
MFAAVCRHHVGCGIGDLTRCAYIEETMRQLPRKLAVRPCEPIDEPEVLRCIAELAKRSCKGVAKSLDLLALQAALDRIPSCRQACPPTASSP